MPHSLFIEQKIRERAYEIYQYRQDNNMQVRLIGNELKEITAENDWKEAEAEICGLLSIAS